MMPDQFLMQVLRPVINWVVERHNRRGQSTPLEQSLSHPYAGLIMRYAGSPIAPVLERTIEEMWASPHLTRRCKLLIFAVIDRGLGCDICALEMRQALDREGLNEAALDLVLKHLDAPELDEIERLLVRFARETIWFDPAVLQRRAQRLRDRLSVAQLVEVIGVTSLANGLCRMGSMVMSQR